MTKNIAIVTGGISSERPVALRSAENMENWVKISGHAVSVFDFPEDIEEFLKVYKNCDLVIPVFHGMYGEDGQITAFLKTLGCKYGYSGFTVHSFCIDKYRTNLFIQKIGIRIPRSFFVAHGFYIERLESPLVCYPVIIKPNRGGSSMNTSKVNSREELVVAQENIKDDDIIIQECIEGREFTVGVYKTTLGYEALPIMEIVTESGLFDYEEKYESDGSNEIFANLSEDTKSELENMSIFIASALKCRGVVRIDWRYDGKGFYFLEVNTIPGFTSASFIPKMWKKAGKTEKDFVEMLFI